jgi:hypothetical protein
VFLSSVETFRVKGFLPAYMGSTVVVPAEEHLSQDRILILIN